MIAHLTILVPTRNRPEDLATCLKSIIAAFGKGQKVIIGDNGDAQETRRVLANVKDLSIRHIENPAGSTYVQNLNVLFSSCESPWASVLHDDDFFSSDIKSLVEPILGDPETDFVFSDHWVCDPRGMIDEKLTTQYYRKYGRDKLIPGIQRHTGILAIQQRIALDGFFIRTSLALSSALDLSQSVSSDVKWLIEVCDQSQKSIYLPDRLFTYRQSEICLTSSSDPLRGSINFCKSMWRTRVKKRSNLAALRRLRATSLIRILRVILGKLKPSRYISLPAK